MPSLRSNEESDTAPSAGVGATLVNGAVLVCAARPLSRADTGADYGASGSTGIPERDSRSRSARSSLVLGSSARQHPSTNDRDEQPEARPGEHHQRERQRSTATEVAWTGCKMLRNPAHRDRGFVMRAVASPPRSARELLGPPVVSTQIRDAANRRRRDGAAAGGALLCLVVAGTDRAVGSGAVGDIVELRVADPVSGKIRPVLADLKQFYGHGQLSPDGRTHHHFSVPRDARAAGRVGRTHGGSVRRRRACVVAAGVTQSTSSRSATAIAAYGCGNSIPRPRSRWPRNARAASSRSAPVDDFDGAASSAHRARAE